MKTYYFKDKDRFGKLCYTLVLRGYYFGRVRTKKAAEDWFKGIENTNS